MNWAAILWFVLMAGFLIAEAVCPFHLVSIWFVAGSLVATLDRKCSEAQYDHQKQTASCNHSHRRRLAGGVESDCAEVGARTLDRYRFAESAKALAVDFGA